MKTTEENDKSKWSVGNILAMPLRMRLNVGERGYAKFGSIKAEFEVIKISDTNKFVKILEVRDTEIS